MVQPAIQRIAREYETDEGKVPFRDWLLSLGDGRAQAKVTKAVKQMEAGNFGDHKAVAGALQERRIDYGPGYRVYYIIEGDELIILFAGSDKPGQQAAIDSAKDYLADYRSRKSTGKPSKAPTRGSHRKR